MIVTPTGLGKRPTFHIAPCVLDFYRHSERDLVDTACLVIFPLVSLMKDQVSILCEKEVKAIVLCPETSDTETKKLQRENTTLCLSWFMSPEELFGGPCSSILALKNKIQAYSSMRVSH